MRISATTIGKFVKEEKFRPYKIVKKRRVPPSSRAARVAWAKAHVDWPVERWMNILFTDELWLPFHRAPNSQNDRCYLPAGEGKNYEDVLRQEVDQHEDKLMAWCGVTGSGKTELHFLPHGSTMTAEYYAEHILEAIVVPLFIPKPDPRLFTKPKLALFQHDGASPHTAKLSEGTLAAHKVPFWAKGQFPPHSPDLSIIENVLGPFTHTLGCQDINSLDMLRAKAIKAWRDIPQASIEAAAKSMPARCKAVIAKKGAATDY
jgi:hypothetical protein